MNQMVTRMRALLLYAAATTALVTAPAHAGDVYGKVFGGAGFEQNHEFSGDIAGFGAGQGVLETETGYAVGGAIGYEIYNGFAVEAEIAYRANEIDGGSIGATAFPGGADIESLSFMGNVVYTAPEVYGFSPYLGGGAGTAGVSFSDNGERDYVFAYQGFAGVKRQLTETLSAGVEYRYFGTDDASFSSNFGAVETDYQSHSANLVFSVSF